MKTRKFYLTVLAIVLAFAFVQAGNFGVDKSNSSVKWLGKKVSGEHFGSIAFSEGHFNVENGKVTGGEFVIDMSTIVVEDIKNATYNGKLLGHLKGDDFFATEKFTTSTLVLKSVKVKAGTTHVFVGHLTIKGKTEPVEFEADITMEGDKLTASGKMMIDRTLYDIKYGSGKFFENLGNKMIDDKFSLEFNIVANK